MEQNFVQRLINKNSNKLIVLLTLVFEILLDIYEKVNFDEKQRGIKNPLSPELYKIISSLSENMKVITKLKEYNGD